jgi:hypothetical protein
MPDCRSAREGIMLPAHSRTRRIKLNGRSGKRDKSVISLAK